MPKGATCLACGKQTWHQGNTGLRRCKGCRAAGWLGDEHPSGGGGRGKKCNTCGTMTLMWLGSFKGKLKDKEIRRCTSCTAVIITRSN